MRVFVAGATGAIGSRLVPLLVADGHEVVGMTRTEAKIRILADHGASGVVVDVFDRDHVIEAVKSFRPDVIIHQLTDLPDEVGRVGDFMVGNARIRREGTDNLLAAATQTDTDRFLAQSVAWDLEGDSGEAVAHLEGAVLDFGGTVLRYGRFYGPGTYHETGSPPASPHPHRRGRQTNHGSTRIRPRRRGDRRVGPRSMMSSSTRSHPRCKRLEDQ